ncbi:hypothetical protein CWI36_0023p0060 [Hamiltosporidium magnivora]|uniref:Uncharacterized protein n=1 Tax=Hamiltosporidium magnivora TaxID=148818 RepID=A0A4Q9LPQ7_9MICR|nr:hypothetical protein CWI36_0023p0060 [Hamiltosporidium magnivora]
MNFERMYMKYLFNILLILKCIKLSNFEREESIDQLVKKIRINASFCVPIFSCDREELKVFNKENNSAVSLKKHKFNNLFCKKIIERFTKKYFFNFIREYTNKIDKLITNSETDIYFIRHIIKNETMEIKMKSSFKKTEENESIEVKNKNVDIPQFMMFLIYNSQVKDLADKEYEIINLLSDISEDFVEKIFHKFVYLCFPSLNSKFLEKNKQVDEVKNLILSFISKKFIEIHNNSKNIFTTIKYIFENCFFKFWTFYLQNREEFQRFLCNPEEVLNSYRVKLRKPIFYINVHFKTKSVQNIYIDFEKNESEKTCEEKNSIAADKLREKLCEYLLNNKENMCDLLKKVLGGYVSFDEDKNLGIYEEFDNILSNFFS